MVDDIRNIEDFESGLEGRDIDDLEQPIERCYDELVKLREKTCPLQNTAVSELSDKPASVDLCRVLFFQTAWTRFRTKKTKESVGTYKY